jgi:hypothetical protein
MRHAPRGFVPKGHETSHGIVNCMSNMHKK